MIRPFGESALLVDVGTPGQAQALAATLASDPIGGVTETVPGLASLLVEFDPLVTDRSVVRTALADRIRRAADAASRGRARVIPVVYGGQHGPDLTAVAGLCRLPEAEVVARHARAKLRVLFGGFAPGFAYLGELPTELRVPRLDTPRVSTPAGSVALADAMTGIYPADLPGGWRVIGRTPITLFDPGRTPPAYLAPGDTVTFRPIAAGEWAAHEGSAGDWG